MSMGATISLKYMTLSFSLAGKYCRLQLDKDGDHVYLPLVGKKKTPSGGSRSKQRGDLSNRGGKQCYMLQPNLEDDRRVGT